jgi:hypothetical protein
MHEEISTQRIESLSALLRGVGAAVLIAAASTFLLQHWQEGNDLLRYAGLLALSGMLSVSGFLCGLRIRDPKSARVFLALAAALVPAHACILGGFVYSQFAWGTGPIPVPDYASWVAPSATAAWLVPIVAGALLIPLAGLSFLALARPRMRLLTALYLAGNAALLVPTRDPEWIAALLAVLSAGLAFFELRVLRRDLALRTLDGWMIHAMLASPLVLMGIRSVLHYDLSWSFGAVTSGTVAMTLLLLSREGSLRWGQRRVLESGGLVAAAATCAFGSAALLTAGFPGAAGIPAAAFPFAGILLAWSLADASGGAARRRAAAAVALAAAGLNLALFPGLGTAWTCATLGIAALGYGFLVGQHALLACGIGATRFARLHHIRVALDLYAVSHWGSLACLGAAVIVAASLMERHHEALRARLTVWRSRLEEWEA